MATDKNFCEHVPDNFSLCFKTDCATADKCLRSLATRNINKEKVNLSIINPLLANPAGEKSCAYFRKAEQVRVAYGFRQALAKIEAGKVRSVRSAIQRLVCQRNYYYLSRGEKPIYPKMQQQIANIFSQHGLPLPIEFDRYEWQHNWNEDA